MLNFNCSLFLIFVNLIKAVNGDVADIMSNTIKMLAVLVMNIMNLKPVLYWQSCKYILKCLNE